MGGLKKPIENLLLTALAVVFLTAYFWVLGLVLLCGLSCSVDLSCHWVLVLCALFFGCVCLFCYVGLSCSVDLSCHCGLVSCPYTLVGQNEYPYNPDFQSGLEIWIVGVLILSDKRGWTRGTGSLGL